ncbi:MAG: hypothetical protein ACJAVZ_003256 [Afipia broomeae]|jgi:hypothetical protein
MAMCDNSAWQNGFQFAPGTFHSVFMMTVILRAPSPAGHPGNRSKYRQHEGRT